MLSNIKIETEYSEKEQELFDCISDNWRLWASATSPIAVYERLAIQCFLGSVISPATVSLQKCLQAIYDCKVFRMTPEFDALIEL